MFSETVSTKIHTNTENDIDRTILKKCVQNKKIPQTHNLSSGSSELLVLPIGKVFKQWQLSTPTLHQYRPEELEVVIHRRTGKVDRLTRQSYRSNNYISDNSPEAKSFNIDDVEHEDDTDQKRCTSPVPSDEQISMNAEHKHDSPHSSMDDPSYDSYMDEDEEDILDCSRCRSLKQKLDETREQVNARQNLIVALTSLNNDQVATRRKLESELRESSRRLKDAEILYSQNIRSIRESLASKKAQMPQPSQYGRNEFKIMELIEKSRTAFAVQRGDPDGVDSSVTSSNAIQKIQLAIVDMSKQIESLNSPPV